MVKRITLLSMIVLAMAAGISRASAQQPTFTVPDTGQDKCYDNNGGQIVCTAGGENLSGQDAAYRTASPAYQDNGDGTVTDLVTGLMWQKTPDIKVGWADSMANATTLNLGGYTDWRVPTLKELYSLMNFNGVTGRDAASSTPYLDTAYFDFNYGDTNAGDRAIDAQYWSSTEYVSATMNRNETVFGVNFADGRIKGYPKSGPNGSAWTAFVRYVRGDTGYGVNDFVDNADGTITDQATGLTWLGADSSAYNAGSRGDGSLNWEEALSWCENLIQSGFDDWRLPNAKEMQAIVDYSRSPDTTNSAAIDPLFSIRQITDQAGQPNYPYFWTSTTHLDGLMPGNYAVYIALGEAQGFQEMPPNSGNTQLMDVHGAGAQRSDPKAGDPAQYAGGHGPQGDDIRIYNYALCVRGGTYELYTGGETVPASNTGQPQPPANNQGLQQPPTNGQGQQGQPGQPPQEAITACNGLTEGAACSITTPQGSLQGTCGTIGAQLACVPAGGPPPRNN